MNKYKVSSQNIKFPTKSRQLCSLGYECITTVTLIFIIGFMTSAIFGSSPSTTLRFILASAIILGISSYYVFCWVTSGQSLAQKSWGLRITNDSGTQVSMRTACKRFLLSTLFNLTMIAPAILLFTKHNQYPQDQLLNTQVTVNDEVRNQV
jgi:uncharacterized RDD family membrane protein YckC